VKTIRAANPRRAAIFGALLLILSLVLLLFARDVIRELVVLPLSYLAWLAGIFFNTAPQIFFWIGLVFVLLLMAYRSLSIRRKDLAEPPPELAELAWDTRRSGQVVFWTNRVHLMRQAHSVFYENSFHQTLGRLLLDLLAYRYRMTPNQVENHLRESSLDVPADVRDYALYSLRRLDPAPVRFWQVPFNALEKAFDTLFRGKRGWRAARPDDPRIVKILKYMEDELEVFDDHTGQ
jgi:hypothetical protein